jgi:hypothetical protein
MADLVPIRRILCICWQLFKFTLRALVYLLVFTLIIILVFRPNYPFGVGWNDISRVAKDDIFNYIDWEIDALSAKVAQTLWGEHPYMDEEDRSQFVRDYMADMGRVHQLEAEIEAIFINPNIDDPQAETVDLRAERDSLRADLYNRQALTESILEGQVATILVEEGFGRWGQLLPPISMRFTEMPNMLITSPRDRIERGTELALDPMPLEEIIALENRIAEEQNLSTLVVRIGGMAIYPAMIQETSNLPWTIETFAHEWIHHYFFFYPLGLNYFIDTGGGSREALIINETVADIFGQEVGQQVLARYYSEYIATTDDSTIVLASSLAQQSAFDYGTEMNRTRVTVDNLMTTIQEIQVYANQLRELGHIDKANSHDDIAEYYIAKVENYMEARRVYFYDNGYRIRRMNQAYFAFYGGYQGGIPGIGGEDPIGPAVRDIRALSPNLKAFVVTLRGISTRDELVTVRDNMGS